MGLLNLFFLGGIQTTIIRVSWNFVCKRKRQFVGDVMKLSMLNEVELGYSNLQGLKEPDQSTSVILWEASKSDFSNLPLVVSQPIVKSTSIVKTTQANWWHHLPANSCSKWGKAPGGGVVQYTCLVGCRLPPLDCCVSVCLVLTIDVYGKVQKELSP